MSLDEVERLATTLPACVISLRLSDADVENILGDEVKHSVSTHYAANVLLQRSAAQR
jgi:hypothetical protein